MHSLTTGLALGRDIKIFPAKAFYTDGKQKGLQLRHKKYLQYGK